MSTLTVALIQTEPHWHDAGRNRALFDRHFDEVPRDAAIVVLPETFSTGFTMRSEQQSEVMSGPTVSWMKASASRLRAVVCGSLIVQSEGAQYNRFIWAQPGGEVRFYDKRHLFRMAGEDRHYSPGRERAIFELDTWRVLPQVCYDLRFPVFGRNRGDYDLAIYVANWPAARQPAWEALLRARAIENQCYVIGVNRIGTDGNEVRYAGGSAAIAFDGTVLVETGEQNGVFSAALDPAALTSHREEFPAWRDADDFDLGAGDESDLEEPR